MGAVAAASGRTSRPPTFYTEVSVDFVEAEVRPEDLEAAGWVYVGKGETGEVRTEDEWERLIEANHDDEHDGPMRWCRHALCEAVAR